jgi:hypothetical protein
VALDGKSNNRATGLLVVNVLNLLNKLEERTLRLDCGSAIDDSRLRAL